MHEDIPLVVPEVNPEALKSHNNIISNPNCSTIQLVLALKPLHDKFKIKRVIVSTYQAVSGAGKESVDELISQTKDYLDNKDIKSENFTKQMAFNLIPHIDVFVEDGYTKEEWKMENETKKILSEEIGMSATCVRVPVKTSHSESVNIEFKNDYDLSDVKDLLSKAPGCKVIDERKDGGYVTPYEAEGNYQTFISRIRKDHSNKKALNIWVVSDNLLKGAALNTVQIAECLLKNIKKIINKMEKDKNPLSPHLQIYRWHISSLLSITHRIVGVINIFAVTLICGWSLFLLLGENNYDNFNNLKFYFWKIFNNFSLLDF